MSDGTNTAPAMMPVIFPCDIWFCQPLNANKLFDIKEIHKCMLIVTAAILLRVNLSTAQVYLEVVPNAPWIQSKSGCDSGTFFYGHKGAFCDKDNILRPNKVQFSTKSTCPFTPYRYCPVLFQRPVEQKKRRPINWWWDDAFKRILQETLDFGYCNGLVFTNLYTAFASETFFGINRYRFVIL